MLSMGTWTWIAWAMLILAPFITGALFWHYGVAEGIHRGKCMEKERQIAVRQREALRAPYAGPEIRAKTGPLKTPGGAMVPGEIPGHSVDAGLTKQRHPDHVTAADLAPVIVPEPGMFKPQPCGTGPHTTTMPKITDTGELRALTSRTDAWLEGMRQKGLIA